MYIPPAYGIQQVEECIHPYVKHPLSVEEKLCQEAEYYLHLLLRERDSEERPWTVEDAGEAESHRNDAANWRHDSEAPIEVEWIPLKELFRFPNISQLCSSTDMLR